MRYLLSASPVSRFLERFLKFFRSIEDRHKERVTMELVEEIIKIGAFAVELSVRGDLLRRGCLRRQDIFAVSAKIKPFSRLFRHLYSQNEALHSDSAFPLPRRCLCPAVKIKQCQFWNGSLDVLLFSICLGVARYSSRLCIFCECKCPWCKWSDVMP